MGSLRTRCTRWRAVGLPGLLQRGGRGTPSWRTCCGRTWSGSSTCPGPSAAEASGAVRCGSLGDSLFGQGMRYVARCRSEVRRNKGTYYVYQKWLRLQRGSECVVGSPDSDAKRGGAMLECAWRSPRYPGTPVHIHGNAINLLVGGRKRWWILPPARGRLSNRPVPTAERHSSRHLRWKFCMKHACWSEWSR